MEWMMGEGQFMREVPTLFPSLDLLVLAWSTSLTHFCVGLGFCIGDDSVSFRDCSLLPWKRHLMWLIPNASNPNVCGFQPSLEAYCLGEGPWQILATRVGETPFDVSLHHSPSQLCYCLWWLLHCGWILLAHSNSCLVHAEFVSRCVLLSFGIWEELFWRFLLRLPSHFGLPLMGRRWSWYSKYRCSIWLYCLTFSCSERSGLSRTVYMSSSKVTIERWMGFTGAVTGVVPCCIIILGSIKCIIFAMVLNFTSQQSTESSLGKGCN